MSNFKCYLEEEQLSTTNKFGTTIVSRQLIKGDIIPLFNYSRQKYYNYEVQYTRALSKNDWFAIKDDLMDYIIGIKVKPSGRVIFETPVLKNGEVSINLHQVSSVDRTTKDMKFMRKTYNLK